jgi:hypothetical protein
MTETSRFGVVLLMFGCGFAAGCSGPSQPSQAAGPPASVTAAAQTFTYPTHPTRLAVTLSGLVFEMTPTGQQPIAGVEVYCDSCGESGHTAVMSDANGFYRFNGDITSGGGVWVETGITTPLIVAKDGYKDPAGLPPRTWPASGTTGWREVVINGDTRFDIQLARR